VFFLSFALLYLRFFVIHTLIHGAQWRKLLLLHHLAHFPRHIYLIFFINEETETTTVFLWAYAANSGQTADKEPTSNICMHLNLFFSQNLCPYSTLAPKNRSNSDVSIHEIWFLFPGISSFLQAFLLLFNSTKSYGWCVCECVCVCIFYMFL
jgi:hypothetical protein